MHSYTLSAIMMAAIMGIGCTVAPVTTTPSKKAKGTQNTSGENNEPTDNGGNGNDNNNDDDNDNRGGNNTNTNNDTTPATNKFACSGAGIAAFADALVNAGRQSCTSHGVGVVRNDNYQCVKGAIDTLAPPHPDTSYSIVTTLLAPNQQYPNLECTYFIQMVTSGVCGTPLSPTTMAWTDYPLAYEFINKAPAGWSWIPNNAGQGTSGGAPSEVQIGDIFVYNTTGGQDPGHIMIVAEIKNGNQFRIAEANELNADGSAATAETGVMSNTRITSLNDPEHRPAGWFRLTAQ